VSNLPNPPPTTNLFDCRWSLPEPDPSDYPDTGQGCDSFAADYAYFEMEKE